MNTRVDGEELDRALVAMAPDALLVVDAHGLVVRANPSAARLFGRAATSLVGERIEVLIPDAAPFRHPQHAERYGHEPHTESPGFALIGRRRDGSTFPAEISLAALGEGEAVLVCVAVHDISDRVNLEASFEGILDAAPDAIVAVDRGGIIKIVNRNAEQLFGYDRAELIGENIERLVPERSREAHPGQRADYALDPRPRHLPSGMSLNALRKDGSEFPVDIALSSIETPDGLLISAAVRDMTERVDAEHERAVIVEGLHRAKLMQVQRLETVGQLAGGIAHDFNNQLAVILNYADFVHEKLPEGELRRDVEEIQKAATQAADLTRQLLIFSRREVTKQVLLNLNDVLTGVESMLRRSLGATVKVSMALAPDLPSILADPGQLEQVILNLAVNARDAMPDGGDLILETSEVELDDVYAEAFPTVLPGLYLRLAISDTGTGMTPAVLARAFEPLFTTKPAGQGTGLGLATVYGSVTQAGGHVRIHSEVGHGTHVSIDLPAINEPAALAKRPKPAAPAAGNGETVLMVEDDAAVLLAALRVLRASGYVVVARSNAADALLLLRERARRFDVLVTAVVLSDTSGVQLGRQALALRPELCILYLSGYSQEVVARQGAMEPGTILLQKPFTRAQLLDAMRQTITGERPSDA
ncbi:MAG: PAS domain S-box protein [Chloroflexota bacterium]|nr:PAS domain S-box protein [Chloroflexota bacterium]